MIRSRERWLSALIAPLTLCLLSVTADAEVANWHHLTPPDQSDWSAKRIANYQQFNPTVFGEPDAVISVPSLDVTAAVYPDSRPRALEAGAAWVAGTTAPGSTGNIAIAGHRDSFFRPLEGIPLGTEIDLVTAAGRQRFAVSHVEIVDALDISPLAASDHSVLTLITCHPFRYQGYAPDRYIIRATLIEESSIAAPGTEPISEPIAGRSGRTDPASEVGQSH